MPRSLQDTQITLNLHTGQWTMASDMFKAYLLRYILNMSLNLS